MNLANSKIPFRLKVTFGNGSKDDRNEWDEKPSEE